MLRWRMLSVLGSAALVAGCAGRPVPPAEFAQRVTPGLANAQSLYGAEAVADEPTQDVVSNGPESCGRNDEHGVLRGQWPACPVHQPGVTRVPQGVSEAQALDPDHASFVVEWPCSRPERTMKSAAMVVACAVPGP